jgi:hypothetical protein
MNFGQLLDLSLDELTSKLETVAAEIDEHQPRGCRYSLMERVRPERGKDHDSLFPALRCPTPISGIAIDAGLGFPTARGTTGKQTDDDASRPHVTRFRREVSAFSANVGDTVAGGAGPGSYFFDSCGVGIRCLHPVLASGMGKNPTATWRIGVRGSERKISQNPLLSFYEL